MFSPSFSIYIIASFRKKVKSFSLFLATRINREFFTHPKMSHGGCQAGSAHSFELLSAKAGRKCFVRRSSHLVRLWNKTKFPRRDGKFSSLIIIPQVFRKVKLFTAYFVEEVTFCGTTLRATGVGVSREVTALRGACGRGFLLSPFVLILYHNFNRFANFQVIRPLQYHSRFVFRWSRFCNRLRRNECLQ